MAEDRSYTLPGASGEDIGLLILGYLDKEGEEVDDTATIALIEAWWNDVKAGTHGDLTLYEGDAAKKAKKTGFQKIAANARESVGLIVVLDGGHFHNAETNASTIDQSEHITVAILNTDELDPTATKIMALAHIHIYKDTETEEYGGYVVVDKRSKVLAGAKAAIFAWQEAQVGAGEETKEEE